MSELSSLVLLLVVSKIQVHILWNSLGSLSLKSLLQIAVNAIIIENRQKTQSTQFVIKFENFNFDVWTVKFSPLISCIEDTGTNTLKLLGQFKFQKFITNCGKCENHRKSPKKTQATQFVIKFENFNFDVWTVKFSPHILWNSWGSLILKSLLQIAANV